MRDGGHHLFYSGNISGDTVVLDSGESNHAVSVLRIKAGQPLQITDGNGTVYDCLCVDIQKQSMPCKILNRTVIPKIEPELTLLVGIPDRDHFETILEHTAALGVSRIVPLVMDHCRKPWWESWDGLRPRFVSKMIVSMKQCLYPYIPKLGAPALLGEVIGACEKPLIVADQRGEKLCDADISRHKKLSCLIGPPGGISANELELLKQFDLLTISIAPTRLRTELAASVVCSRIIGAYL
jgi:16S rRNA (uracil1498-N3)-methyltransferase